MKEMKGRKRREREWKSQLGKWRRSRRAPSGKFGSGIREFYHGVQWPTQVSAHVGSNCLPLLAERKKDWCICDFLFFFFSFPLLRIIKKAIGTSIYFKYSKCRALWMSNKVTSSQRLPSRFTVWYSQIFTREGSQHLTGLVCSLPTVVSQLGFNMTGWIFRLLALSLCQLLSYVFVIANLMYMMVMTNFNLIQCCVQEVHVCVVFWCCISMKNILRRNCFVLLWTSQPLVFSSYFFPFVPHPPSDDSFHFYFLR